MGPADVAALLEKEGSRGVPPDEYDEANEPADARQRRTDLLLPVLTTCYQLWESQSTELDLIAQKLGDGSRDVAWRLPFGDSGLLKFFANLLDVDGLRTTLYVHALRLVGNSCADTDENRAKVVEENLLPAVIRRLGDENLIPFTIPVTYNVLVDYEPAQKAASQLNINHRLISLLSSPNLANYAPFVTYFCKILTLLITQEGEATRANPDTAPILLKLATAHPHCDDLDDFTSLSGVAAAYLASESLQEGMLSEPNLTLLLGSYYHAQTGFPPSQPPDADVESALKQCRSALLNVLSDLSANDTFLSRHPFGSPISDTLFAWLRGPITSLVPAACLVMGNLSRSDAASTALVHNHAAHVPLIKLLSDPSTSDPQTLHSALSFLKNLAIPAANKLELGASGLLDTGCVPRIIALDTLPQVQFSAVSLLRLLLVSCPANVRRICTRLSKDESSPSYDRSGLHGLVSLFERTDAEPTKLEAARSIAAICRVLHSNPAADTLPEWSNPKEDAKSDDLGDDGKRREEFYSHHHLSTPLAFLVSQPKWPILRSEAWFVFALMCRSKDGAGVILHLMFDIDATAALMKAVTGRDTLPEEEGSQQQQQQLMGQESASSAATVSMLPEASGIQLEPQQVDPKQMESMAKIDRENCVVLCTEMLRHWGSEMPQLRASMWQDLVKEGTELIAKDRGQ